MNIPELSALLAQQFLDYACYPSLLHSLTCGRSPTKNGDLPQAPSWTTSLFLLSLGQKHGWHSAFLLFRTINMLACFLIYIFGGGLPAQALNKWTLNCHPAPGSSPEHIDPKLPETATQQEKPWVFSIRGTRSSVPPRLTWRSWSPWPRRC